MRAHVKTFILCLFIPVVLVGCDFKPLYSERTLASERNASILIMPITETAGDHRSSQILHNFLRDRLNPAGMPADPEYKLQINLTQSNSTLVTRRFLEMKTSYKLLSAQNERVLYNSDTISRVHYDVFAKEYDSRPALEAAKRNAMTQTADDIARAISLRLGRI